MRLNFWKPQYFILCYLFIFHCILIIGVGFILVYKSAQEPFKIEDQMDQLIEYLEFWDLIVKSFYISNRLLNALNTNTALLWGTRRDYQYTDEVESWV